MTQEQEKVSKEQLILEAAEYEFFTKGFAGARTTSIAERAGVTHAMLHYYYRTKEQLFERVVEKNATTIGQTMLAAMGNPAIPIIERLRDGISAHFDLIVAHPLLPRFFLNEIVAYPERYSMLTDNLGTTANKLFSELQCEANAAFERGEIEQVDVRMLFLSMLSLNIFPFVVYPFGQKIMSDIMGDKESFLERRKAENIELIIRRIKKQQ